MPARSVKVEYIELTPEEERKIKLVEELRSWTETDKQLMDKFWDSVFECKLEEDCE